MLFSITRSIHLEKVQFRNSILRFYVFSLPKRLRQEVVNRVSNTHNKIYILYLEANSKYFSLSEDDRTIIETILSLTF
jgi:hypothetical protein